MLNKKSFKFNHHVTYKINVEKDCKMKSKKNINFRHPTINYEMWNIFSKTVLKILNFSHVSCFYDKDDKNTKYTLP